jgi:cytochrome c-type biogenesis protein CcmH/NrfF
VRRLLLAVVAALALAAPALASERHPSLAELESRIMCPICHTTLDQSDSPIARRMKAFIAQRIAAGDTTSQIEDKLVAQFGPGVLASPSRHGLNLLVWVLPPVGIVLAAIVLGVLAFRWSRSREPAPAAGGPALDPELERRLDEELARFDR